MAENLFDSVPSSSEWTKIQEIKKGWSRDKKFYVETLQGKKLLLRLSGIDTFKKKKKEFEMMEEIWSLGITMSEPLAFGACELGRYVYSLASWIEGTAAEEVVPNLSAEEQYALGFNAGRILKRFHSVEAPPGQVDWEMRMNKKFDTHLEKYKE